MKRGSGRRDGDYGMCSGQFNLCTYEMCGIVFVV